MKIRKNKKIYSLIVIILLCTVVFLSFSNSSELDIKEQFTLPELAYKYNEV